MELFDILNALFTDKLAINNLTKESAKQNIFMINRRLAIKYPLQVHAFNSNKINAYDVLKFWSEFLYTGGKPPYWLYTKGAVKSAEKKSKDLKPKEINKYLADHSMSRKDFESAYRFFPDKVVQEIKEYNKLIGND